MKQIRIEKIIFIFLISIIILELLFICYRVYNNRRPLKIHKCQAAYNCKIDKNKSEFYVCKYIDEEGKVENIKCAREVINNE